MSTATGMTRQQIGVTDFAREGITVSVSHRIAVRRLATASWAYLCKTVRRLDAVPRLLTHILERANDAGGEPPLPEPPDRTLVTDLQGISGNQQVVEVAGNVEKLIKYYQDCSQATEVIRERIPAWEQLEALLRHTRLARGSRAPEVSKGGRS